MAAVLSIAGCSGAGSSVVPVDSQNLKSQVVASVAQGFSAHAAVGQPGGSSSRPLAPESAYFDDYFQLYAMPVENGVDYFVDQAMTQPAGQERTVSSLEGGAFFQTSTTEITAGPRAGYRSTSVISGSEDAVEISIEGVDPTSGAFEIEGAFEGDSGTFSSAFEDEQGLRRTFSVSYRADGASQVIFNSASDFIYTLEFRADDSGTGQITGSSAVLPASVEWNVDGDGAITFADGSTVEFESFDFEQI